MEIFRKEIARERETDMERNVIRKCGCFSGSDYDREDPPQKDTQTHKHMHASTRYCLKLLASQTSTMQLKQQLSLVIYQRCRTQANKTLFMPLCTVAQNQQHTLWMKWERFKNGGTEHYINEDQNRAGASGSSKRCVTKSRSWAFFPFFFLLPPLLASAKRSCSLDSRGMTEGEREQEVWKGAERHCSCGLPQWAKTGWSAHSHALIFPGFLIRLVAVSSTGQTLVSRHHCGASHNDSSLWFPKREQALSLSFSLSLYFCPCLF